jgi:hypothetical protein
VKVVPVGVKLASATVVEPFATMNELFVPDTVTVSGNVPN